MKHPALALDLVVRGRPRAVTTHVILLPLLQRRPRPQAGGWTARHLGMATGHGVQHMEIGTTSDAVGNTLGLSREVRAQGEGRHLG